MECLISSSPYPIEIGEGGLAQPSRKGLNQQCSNPFSQPASRAASFPKHGEAEATARLSRRSVG